MTNVIEILLAISCIDCKKKHNWCQIQIGIPACVMSCENSTRTSLLCIWSD